MYGTRSHEHTAENVAPARPDAAPTRWSCGQGRHPMLVHGQCVECAEYDLED